METKKMKELIHDFHKGKIEKHAYIHQMHTGFHQKLFEYAERLPATDLKEISIRNNKVLVTFNKPIEMTFTCDPRDERICPIETFNFGTYEPVECHWILSLAQSAQTLLDIGANIGFYSIALGKTYPQCQIHSFEPIPQTFSYLQENIQLNAVPNIHIYRTGLSDQEGVLKFFFDSKGSGNASAKKLDPNSSTVEEMSCPVEKLDQFVARQKLVVDFIKCDVEGAELLVLRGAKATLQKDKPILFLEMLRKWSAAYDYHPNDIIRFLRDMNYGCYSPQEKTLKSFHEMTEQTLETNFFFLHKEKHKEVILKYSS